MDYGESWQEAGAREVWEEARVELSPYEIQEFRVRSTPADNQILIFGVAQSRSLADLAPFEPTAEATERSFIKAPQELAFPLHTEVVKTFFNTGK